MKWFGFRPRSTRGPRRGLLLFSWLLRMAVVIAPVVFLAWWGLSSLLSRTNSVLQQSEPLVNEWASRAARRPVRIGLLAQDLSLKSLWSMFVHRDSIGVFAVRASQIDIATKRTEYRNSRGKLAIFDEPALTRSPIFIRAESATVYVSMPALLARDFNRALPRIEVTDPSVVLVRAADGQLSFLHILPSNPNAKPAPPFETVIEVEHGRLRMCDYDSADAPGQLAENTLADVNGMADLRATSNYRFSATAIAAPSTPTVERLQGRLAVDGSWGRVGVGQLPNGPTADSARFLVHLTAENGDAPYWVYYFLKVGQANPEDPRSRDIFHLDRGRADVTVTVAAPRTDILGGPTPGIGVSLSAKFSDLRLTSGYVPTAAIDSARGTLDYEDGTASFAASGRALDGAINAAGTLYNLNSSPTGGRQPVPELTINVHASALPSSSVFALAHALLPPKSVPPALRLGGVIGVDGLVSGPANDPVAAGRVSGAALSWDGLPIVRNVGANVEYAGGVIGVSDLAGDVDSGGRFTGRGAVRVLPTASAAGAATPLGGPAAPAGRGRSRPGDAEFAVNAENVNLATLAAIRNFNNHAGKRLRLDGIGSVETVGIVASGALSAAANVTTSRLRVGSIAFPVARARVLVTRTVQGATSFVLPEAQLESADGALTASGTAAPAGRLAVHWAASALNIAPLLDAFGLNSTDPNSPGTRFSGVVSGTGGIDGTPEDPRITVDTLSGLNLRATNVAADHTPRRFSIDSVEANQIVATRRGVSFPHPVLLRRFPAVVSVTGYVAGILPGEPGTKYDPHLNLTGSVTDLQISEIDRQLSTNVGRLVRQRITNPTSDANAPGVAGAIARANIVAVGPVSNPTITGSAVLGDLVVDSYPIDSGSFAFAYQNRQTHLTDIKAAASLGSVSGDAAVGADGTLSGSFAAKSLDLEKLVYLTRARTTGTIAADQTPAATLAAAAPVVQGTIAVTGRVSGTLSRPVVDADIPATTLKVYGLALNDFRASGLEFVYNGAEKMSRIQVGAVSLKQVSEAPACETSVHLTGASVEIPLQAGEKGAIHGDLSASTTDGGALLLALQRANLVSRSVTGNINGAISGALKIDALHLQGALERESKDGAPDEDRLIDASGSADVSAANLVIGHFAAPVLKAHASLANETFSLEDLTVQGPVASYQAHGTLGMDHKIDAVIVGKAVPIEIAQSLKSLQGVPVTGSADVSVLVKGSLEAPSISATMEGHDVALVTGPTANQVIGTAQAMTAPRFPLDVARGALTYAVDAQGEGTIAITDLQLAHKSASLRLSGSLPVSSDLSRSRRAISLSLSTPAMDLNDLSELVAEVNGAPEAVVTPAAPPKRRWWDIFSRRKAPAAAAAPQSGLGGTLALNVKLGGTIDAPQLDGDITLAQAQLDTAIFTTDGKRHFNQVKDAEVHLLLSGQSVNVGACTVALGGADGKSTGSYGTVNVTGSVAIGLLQNGRLRQLLSSGRPARLAVDSLRSSYADLLVTMKDFKPVADNLFGYGEYITGRVNGALTVTGAISQPTISTPALAGAGRAGAGIAANSEPGAAESDAALDQKAANAYAAAAATLQPILIEDGQLKVSSAVPATTTARGGGALSPRFNIPLSIVKKATISESTTFEFDVNGNALVHGKLPEPGAANTSIDSDDFTARATLRVVGGSFNLLTLAHFTIRRSPSIGENGSLSSSSALNQSPDSSQSGTIELRYNSANPSLIAHDIQAVARIYVGTNSNIGSYAQTVNNTFIETSQIPTVGANDAYVITATINGPLNVFDTSSGVETTSSEKGPVSFTAVPYADQTEILALLGGQQALDQGVGGNSNTNAAINDYVNHAIYNSLVPTAFAPITTSIQNALSLEDLSLNYDPSGSSQVFLAKRFPYPFDRFVAQYTQQIQTRGTQQLTYGQPYLFSLSYELFELKPIYHLQPRVQVGISNDEQHVTTYFLRSSASF